MSIRLKVAHADRWTLHCLRGTAAISHPLCPPGNQLWPHTHTHTHKLDKQEPYEKIGTHSWSLHTCAEALSHRFTHMFAWTRPLKLASLPPDVHIMEFYLITYRTCSSSLPSFFPSHKPLYVRISEHKWRPIHQTRFSGPLRRETVKTPLKSYQSSFGCGTKPKVLNLSYGSPHGIVWNFISLRSE